MLSVVNDLGVINFLLQSNRQGFHNAEQFRLVLKRNNVAKAMCCFQLFVITKDIFFP